MKVDLPEAEARALQSESQDLVITINQNKTLDINGSPVEFSRLEPILTQIKEERNIKSVFLQADKGIPYGFVVQVMSLLRSTGLNEINLVTQPLSKK
jgi:biopolymer transport protein TolR